MLPIANRYLEKDDIHLRDREVLISAIVFRMSSIFQHSWSEQSSPRNRTPAANKRCRSLRLTHQFDSAQNVLLKGKPMYGARRRRVDGILSVLLSNEYLLRESRS